jgi:PsbN protein
VAYGTKEATGGLRYPCLCQGQRPRKQQEAYGTLAFAKGKGQGSTAARNQKKNGKQCFKKSWRAKKRYSLRAQDESNNDGCQSKPKSEIYTQKSVIRPFITPFIMESSAFFIATLIACLLLSITSYSLYVGFGPPSQELRDPFEEHED